MRFLLLLPKSEKRFPVRINDELDDITNETYHT